MLTEVISTLTSKMGASMNRKLASERDATRALSVSSEARVHASTDWYVAFAKYSESAAMSACSTVCET